jgi:hypothetical protein
MNSALVQINVILLSDDLPCAILLYVIAMTDSALGFILPCANMIVKFINAFLLVCNVSISVILMSDALLRCFYSECHSISLQTIILLQVAF